MAQLFNGDRLVALDSNGKVIAGAQLFFYQTGTTTLQTVYADSGATTPLSNPVVADAGGLFPAIYLANSQNAYKTVLLTAAGATVRTTDPINAGAGTSTTFIPQGRLTLASGVPVMTSNQASATSIIYTPYTGNQIPIYDGVSSFSALTFAELTNSTTQSSTGNAGPAAVTTNKNYDLFVWSNAGNPTLTRGGAWNSDTVRSSTTENDLQMINGILTNKNAITNGPAANRGTYVGSVRSDGSSQINWVVGGIAASGTAAVLGVWNAYNRVLVAGFIGDTANSWNYTSATIRAADASTTMRVSFLQGIAEDFFTATYGAICAPTAGSGFVGIGFNSTTAFSGRTAAAQAASSTQTITASHRVQQLGWGFLQACEAADGANTSTFYGDNGGTVIQSGLEYAGRM